MPGSRPCRRDAASGVVGPGGRVRGRYLAASSVFTLRPILEAFSRKIDGRCGLVPDVIEDVFESARVLRAEVPLAQLREYLVEKFLDLRDNDNKRA